MNRKNEQVKGKLHEVDGKLTGNVGNVGIRIKDEIEQEIEDMHVIPNPLLMRETDRHHR
jgi:uncharacterized protein YjbJ (UPF0337 family)